MYNEFNKKLIICLGMISSAMKIKQCTHCYSNNVQGSIKYNEDDYYFDSFATQNNGSKIYCNSNSNS